MSTGRSKRQDFDTTPLMLNFDQRVKPKSKQIRETGEVMKSASDYICCCIRKSPDR